MPIAKIDNRLCLDVTGEDAFAFLQGIITNDLKKLESQSALYACFLTPQGKFLHDFIITMIEGGYRLEVLKATADNLLKAFKIYKLRSKVQVTKNEYIHIYAFWDGDQVEGAYQDPRLEAMGARLVTDEAIDTTATFADYDRHRMAHGLPDGERDLTPQLSSIYDANIDLLNGVSFEKGCYLGQELTARIHYRGLVKKRLFTITTDTGDLTSGEDILDSNDRRVGVVYSALGNMGLAQLKLSAYDDGHLKTTSTLNINIKKSTWLTF